MKMKNRNRPLFSSPEVLFDTSCDPSLYPLASLSLAFSPTLLLPQLPPPLPQTPSTVASLATGNLPRVHEVVPWDASPSTGWSGALGSGCSEWSGTATAIPYPESEEEILRFKPNRRVDYSGATTTAMATDTRMKWGGSASDAPSGRSVRSMLNDALTRHSRIVPLGHTSRKGKSRTPSQGSEGAVSAVADAEGEGGVEVRQKRVLILMSDTGGGHRASAEAIKATFEQEYGGEYSVSVVDLWKEHTPWPFNQMPKSYSFLVKHETLWKVAFHVTKPRFVHQPQMAATSAFVAREVAKGLIYHKPDVIVSVHPLMQHIPLRVLKAKGLLTTIPFTTVITDLTTCHPTWFHKLVTTCFCPTAAVSTRALKAGLKQNQIKVHGLPIRPSFCKPTPPKEDLRRDLGMDLDLPAVLLMGGGEGMGPVEATARALGKALGGGEGGGEPLGQIVVICGRNKKLEGKLAAVKWKIPVVIKGFVTNMPEWMAAADCVISKAGPGTIAESMIRGLPMIINDYIAGQEVGNVPFVVENGAGKFCEKPAEIARTVADWFGPKEDELRQMSENALKLARPRAVFEIVKDLDALARRKDLVPTANVDYVREGSLGSIA